MEHLFEPTTESLQDGSQASHQTDTREDPKKTVPRHPRSSTRRLKEWISLHSAWPYPTDKEKKELSDQTGLTTRQICYWFVNARRRCGQKLSSSAPAACESSAGLLLASFPQHERIDWADLNPLDRWRHSPPEEEPAPLHVLSRAIQDNPVLYDSLATNASLVDTNWTPSTGAPPLPSSLDSFDLSTSASSSEFSASLSSSGSISGFQGGARPRRKRLRRKNQIRDNPAAAATEKKSAVRPFQCTFCTDSFKSRYDWTRHEGTLHLVLERWTCLPFGPVHYDETGNFTKCALCGISNPEQEHIESHRAHECTIKPLGDRTFYRKDHLRQHLRLTHGVENTLPSMESWKSKLTRVKSRCGFCGETFLLWSDRNDHLTEHFRSGARMKDWKGCRGLEPQRALLVENAMPPYLIGTESNDPEPFSATKGKSKTIDFSPGTQDCPPSTFAALTARLGAYVCGAKSEGITITDENLREEARVILYEDNDPWNQTPADNVEWLRMFKAGYGLPSQQYTPPNPTPNGFETSIGLGECPEPEIQVDSNLNLGPFTVERMRQAIGPQNTLVDYGFNAGQLGSTAYVDDSGLAVPWAWQTPECLMEFNQMGQASSVSGMFPNSTEWIEIDINIPQPVFLDGMTSCLNPDTGRDSTDNAFMMPDTIFPFDLELDKETGSVNVGMSGSN